MYLFSLIIQKTFMQKGHQLGMSAFYNTCKVCLSGNVEFWLLFLKPSTEETLLHTESPEMPPTKKRRQQLLVEMPEEVSAMRPSSQGDLFTQVYIFYETCLQDYFAQSL